VIGERDVGAVTRLTARHVARGLSTQHKKRACSKKGSAMPREESRFNNGGRTGMDYEDRSVHRNPVCLA
jgi:hypothetical protein